MSIQTVVYYIIQPKQHFLPHFPFRTTSSRCVGGREDMLEIRVVGGEILGVMGG